MPFKTGFYWGAGSAAYQTEGAWNEDGKGSSIWDEFCHSPGRVRHEETGDTAADSYHRFAEDLAIMKTLGLNSYRFSVSWPRIFPEGSGKPNRKGLDYYDMVVDSLLSSGITPFLTLYHWDLPFALEQQGGWENRSTAEAFINYAAFIAKHFSGRVRHYITLNEPQCFIGLGYGSGIHAPGKQLSDEALARCIHHVLLAHGGATAAMRAACNCPVEIGLASTGKVCYPESFHPVSKREYTAPSMPHDNKHNIDSVLKAACDATFSLWDNWTFSHTCLLDAAVFGRYPDELPALRRLNETISEFDRSMIREPMDFIGLNIYNGIPVDAYGNAVKKPPGFPRTALKWPVTPECMYYGPRFIYDRYRIPIIVTENGLSCNDRIYMDGTVHDADRIDFLTRYLVRLKQAAESGVPVNGYFHWSLTDNFEWHSGFDERFGLVYIDYSTQRRVIKDSGYWYRDVINSGATKLSTVTEY